MKAGQVLTTFSKIYWRNAFIKTHWRSLEQIRKKWWFFDKVILPKVGQSWLKLGFQLPKTLYWSLFGSILAVQNPFLNNLLVFGGGYTFLVKDWWTDYEALSSSLKCYTWSANLRIYLKYTSSYFSPILMHFWIKKNKKNQCSSPT